MEESGPKCFGQEDRHQKDRPDFRLKPEAVGLKMPEVYWEIHVYQPGRWTSRGTYRKWHFKLSAWGVWHPLDMRCDECGCSTPWEKLDFRRDRRPDRDYQLPMHWEN